MLKEQTDPIAHGVERYVAGEHMETENVHIRKWGNVGDGYLGPAFIRRFRKGQVLYGSRRTYLKKVAVAECDGVTANTTFVLEAVEGKLLQELLPWLMLSERFTKHSIQESKGSTNPYINFPDIAKFEFALPPLDQQRRIAEILWAVDEVARATALTRDASIQLAGRYLDSLFKFREASGQKTPFGCICGKWRLSRMDQEGDVQLGQQKHPKYDSGTNVRPYLRVDNVRDGWIDTTNVLRMHFPEKELVKFELQAGDILLNEGQTREYLGRSAIYRGEIPGCCFQKTLIRFRCNNSLLPEFAQAFFSFLLYSGFFASHPSQTAIAHVTAIRFKKMPIPVPPLAEQRRIVEELQRIHQTRGATEAHLAALRSLLREFTRAIT